MTIAELEKRISVLEKEVASLKSAPQKKHWWDEIAGTFADDPMFEQAMRYGREWRESQRPQPQKKTPAKSKRKARK